MKHWKIFVIVFVSGILSFLPSRLSKGCGPDLSFQGYSFVLPAIVNQQSSYAPYFFKFDDFYNNFDTIQKIQQKGNLEEWQEIFCDLVKIEDLETVIYKTSFSEMKVLRTSIQNKKYPLSPRLRKNSFARHLKKNGCLETIDYLVFAKHCEPYVIRSNNWETPERDTFAMQNLIEEGIDKFLNTKSNYIRHRYAYQLIRLAHYKKNYPQVLELYDYLLPKTDQIVSILNYWTLGHKAGALKSLGNRVEAAYLFSRIFDESPSKRESAFRSFSIQTDEEWEACLLMCQSDRERATLYALRANARNSIAAEAMEKIYELDPSNENLELLLVKEIRELERDLLGIEFNDKKKQNKQFHNLPRKKAGDYLVTLQTFVLKCIDENKVARPELWQLANGYLEYLAGDLYASEKSFNFLKKSITNKLLIEQLDIFMLAHKINSFETIDNEDEKEIADIITDNPLYKKYKSFPDFLNDRLAYVYKKQGNPGKAFRCRYDIKALKPNPQPDIIEDLLNVCRKEELSKFERALITKSDGTTIENELMDLKGTYFMAQGRLEAALEVLKRIPRNEWDLYQFNPFIDFMQDCVNECQMPDSIEYFNKVEIIQKIFELEYKAKADFERGAEYNYQLGTAFYNMSYFGHSWQVMDFFRSGSNWSYDKDGVFSDYYFPFGNLENQDLTKALEYFEKARSVANDFEFGAKAAFMAAKCEQKMYYVSKDCTYSSYGNEIPVFPEEYNRYFRLLKENYSATDFYQLAIQECKFFEAYATK
jgi:hypothetical protein